MAKKKLLQKLQDWVEARRRHHLSHARVQMARELGMNPNKLGNIDNHRQESWKAKLPQFIESLYEKRFGRARPETVMSIEERARAKAVKKAESPGQRNGAVEGGEAPADQGRSAATPVAAGKTDELSRSDVQGEPHDR
jgi:hypothetical protein